jgi:hypothetical protein
MTSAQARSRLATRLVYFSVVATVFVFVSMLLLTGLHRYRLPEASIVLEWLLG